MRSLAIPAMILGLVLPGGAAAGTERTWAWVEGALRAELAAPSPDLNKVASLAYPLAAHYPKSQVLDLTARFLNRRQEAGFSCAELADHLLVAGFLAKTGRKIATTEAGRRRTECQGPRGSLFDRVGLLLEACLFSAKPEDPRRSLPGTLEMVTARQTPDGGFLNEAGRPDYYLSSHATLALWACGGDPRAVWRGQQFLARTLPAFHAAGFLDGLAESLIFLKWMKVPPPGWESHAARLLGKARPDGGLCFQDRPDCAAHWHATSLVLELDALAKSK